MQEKVNHITALILKYLREELSPAEKTELDNWVAEHPSHRELLDKIEQEQVLQKDIQYLSNINTEKYWQQIIQQVTPVTPITRSGSRWKWMAVAGILLILIAAAYFYFFKPGTINNDIVQTTPEDIAPGGNRAILKLADGSVIVLDSVENGVLRDENGVVVRKLSDGELEYHPSTSSGSEVGSRMSEALYNELSTPKGGQYQLRLPDGSRAWLNAASSIKYPVAFAMNERRVEITGEVYFEVAPANTHPFIVTFSSPPAGGGGREGAVEVLGTHFNIMAYDNEPAVKTTLLEGLLRVTGGNDKRIIQPGQQAQIDDKRITNVVPANTDAVVAWKNGLFSFADTDVPTIMRQIERWYDIEVVYEGEVPQTPFSGDIPRDLKASEVVEMLEYAGIQLRIEGRRIVVSQ